MNDDIWKTAPVGATHLCEKPVEWYKLSPEGWLVWYAKAERWHTSFIKERTNELVARPTAPQWNGTGLPPVGVVCEVMSTTASDEWLEAMIVAHDGDRAVYRLYDGSYGGDLEFFEDNPARPLFRPIRTPEQIAAEERDVTVKNMVDRFALYSHPDIQWRALFEQMYDCGCRMTAEEKR